MKKFNATSEKILQICFLKYVISKKKYCFENLVTISLGHVHFYVIVKKETI